jgi:DNA-binding Lrp family transcriptional regulator
MLEGYLSAYADTVSVTGIVKFTNVSPQTALQIINKLVSEGRLIKGRGCGIWKYVDGDDATLKMFAMSWLKVDDEIRRYAVQFIQEVGSYRPAEAMSTWTNRIRDDLYASESYDLFLTEHKLNDDLGFESYVKSEISKISMAFDVEGVSHKKKSGGIDIDPNILQEIDKRDINFDGWDDLV